MNARGVVRVEKMDERDGDCGRESAGEDERILYEAREHGSSRQLRPSPVLLVEVEDLRQLEMFEMLIYKKENSDGLFKVLTLFVLDESVENGPDRAEDYS